MIAARVNLDDCLAELADKLTESGLRVATTADERGRSCLDVHDRYDRPRRVYACGQFYWFTWGDDHDARHSLFRVDEAAARLADTATSTGWPDGGDVAYRPVESYGF